MISVSDRFIRKLFKQVRNLLSFPLLLTSCQFGNPYRTPPVETPINWKTHYGEDAQSVALDRWKATTLASQYEDRCGCEGAVECESLENEEIPNVTDEATCSTSDTAIKQLGKWWEVFNDPVLNDLEEQAIRANYSLWAALERIIQARAIAGVNSSVRWPQISLDPSFVRNVMLEPNPIFQIGGGGLGGGTTAQVYNPGQSDAVNLAMNNNAANAAADLPKLIRFRTSSFTLPFDFSYEVDLWNRLNNTYYASVFRAEASVDDYVGILVSLTSDVASNYFILRGLDTQQEVLQKTIVLRQEALDINQARYSAGIAVYSDVTRARVELYSARANSVDVSRQRVLQENILAILLGTPASIFSLKFNPIEAAPPLIPPGLPSELLCRRPDIAEAERNLAAAHADINVAYAAFFPSLRLTASLGLESPNLEHLFTWQARFWQVGFNIMQTIFSAGRNSANLLYYIAKYRETLLNYEQQVLTAFKDVEDALINLQQRAAQQNELTVAVEAARQTLSLSQTRYTRGLVNYLEVVDAERDLLNLEETSAQVLAQRYLSTVLLVKALGGGWGPCDGCTKEDMGNENLCFYEGE